MLKNRYFNFFWILTMVAFSSCTSGQNTNNIDIHAGFEGLSLQFSENAPPPKILEKTTFPVLVKVANKGAYSIKDFGASLAIGTEKDYITSFELEENSLARKGSGDEIQFSIDGKTDINKNGDQLIIALNAKAGSLEQQSEQKATTLTATVCYPYKTILSTTECIDPDIGGLRKETKVCAVKEQTYASGQGAPIAVTRIESYMLAEADNNNVRPEFLIFVENRGSGSPVNPQSDYLRSVCSKSDYGRDTWNVAYLRAYTTGTDNELDCAPSQEGDKDKKGLIRLRDKKDYVRCTFSKPIPRNSEAYTSPLRVEIEYGYVDTTPVTFVIQRPLRH